MPAASCATSFRGKRPGPSRACSAPTDPVRAIDHEIPEHTRPFLLDVRVTSRQEAGDTRTFQRPVGDPIAVILINHRKHAPATVTMQPSRRIPIHDPDRLFEAFAKIVGSFARFHDRRRETCLGSFARFARACPDREGLAGTSPARSRRLFRTVRRIVKENCIIDPSTSHYGRKNATGNCQIAFLRFEG